MKNSLLKLLPVVLLLIVLACGEKKVPAKTEQPDINTAEVDLVKAKQMLTTSCYVCHSPTAPENSRLAPPMEAVKRRYLANYPDKETFIEKLSTFVVAPKEENAIMYGAVTQYNLMTPMPFPEEDLKAIAEYIFTSELEYPDWFDDHYNEMHGNGNGPGAGMGSGRQNQQRQGQTNN